jgi:hypothetical protein
MSDYVSELRRDLVEAAERQQRRGRAAQVARPLHPRAWSPVALAGAAAMAALVLVVVMTLSTLAPPPRPSGKVVATVHLGGQPRDAVLADGSLWIADFEGRVVQLDPATRRVRARIGVGGTPVSITATRGAVWVMSVDDVPTGASRSHLYELDARTGRILNRVAVNGMASTIDAGAGGLWLIPSIHRGDVERIDLDSHLRTAFFPKLAAEELVVTDQSVWTRRLDSVVEIDATSGRVINRVRGISSILAPMSGRTLLPDRDGAWLLGATDGLLLRVEGGRMVRRIAVGATPGVLARVGTAVWVSASRGPAGGNELVRVDADEGKVTQRIGFGYDVPQTLVPVGKDLWVITSGGEAKLVSPE